LLLSALLIAVPAAAEEKAKDEAKAPAVQAAATEKKAPAPGVVARVGTETITEQQVDEIMNRMSTVGRPPDAKRRLVDQMVDVLVFSQEARKAGLMNDPDVQRRVKEATNIVLFRTYVEHLIANVKVSDEAAQKVYDQNKNNYVAPAQLKLQHILVKDKKKAEEISAKLKKDASFEELAKQESKDPMSAQKGGDLGWMSVGSLDPNFEKAASALKKGEISAPVQSRFGYHIIKLNDKKDKHPMAFEDVKNTIKDSLKTSELEKMRKDVLSKADIEIFLKDEPKVEPTAQPGAAKKAPEIKKAAPKAKKAAPKAD
jgi:peptidyl-prolyl cis-trans isomerase C